MQDIAAGAFHRDLYERFDQRVHVPSLNERNPDFNFIFDTVMQNRGINPGLRIAEISEPAYAFLVNTDYSEGWNTFSALASVKPSVRAALASWRSI